MKLRRLHRRARATSEATPWEDVLTNFTDPVIVTDRDSRIVFFNPAAEELTGVARARVLGEPCAHVFATAPLVADMIDRVQRQGQSESHGGERLELRHRSIAVRVTCIPLWDDSDRVRGTVLVIHDLSYQKTLEETARRNESLARLGTLVAGLAHEVKNPLAGIKGAAQILEGRVEQRDDLRQCTTVIIREVDRLSRLVEDLLMLGAPPKPRLVPLNIHRVIQHVLALVGPDLTQRGIQLRCEFDPSLPDVQGDDSQLSQVFLNLLKNAIEAMNAADPRPGAAITISTRMETDFHILREHDRTRTFLRVEIADQGIGIGSDDAVRIFEPFFTTKPRGTGLGLAISHRIVVEHGGIMRAMPNQPRGTVLTVTLPVSRT